MPAKSRRKRNRNLPAVKSTQPAAVNTPLLSSSAASEPVKVVAARENPALPTGKKQAPPVTAAAVKYTYVTAELWTIGILAIILFAILGILSVVF